MLSKKNAPDENTPEVDPHVGELNAVRVFLYKSFSADVELNSN